MKEREREKEREKRQFGSNGFPPYLHKRLFHALLKLFLVNFDGHCPRRFDHVFYCSATNASDGEGRGEGRFGNWEAIGQDGANSFCFENSETAKTRKLLRRCFWAPLVFPHRPANISSSKITAMAGIVEEDIFLTEQQNLHDGVCDCSNDEEKCDISFGNMQDALLIVEIEALDVQLENFEFECDHGIGDNVDAFVDRQPDTYINRDRAVPKVKLPVAIDVKDILFTDTISGNMGSIDVIERNKNLCSTTNRLLTVEEEERIAEMMRQEEEDVEQYGFCIQSTEKNREAEIDELLLGLGYGIENDNTPVGCEQTEREEEIKMERGDPILRELAKKRIAGLSEQRVDEALHKLLLEPLPHVVRINEDGVEGQDVGAQLPVVCEDATLTASVADEEICNLVQLLKKEFEDEGLALADHESIRALARSIMDQELSKNSGSLWH